MQSFAVAGIAIGAAVLFGAGLYWSRRLQQKRREALQQIALEMRWSFSAEGDDALLASLRGFHLFSRGSSRRLRNLLRGSLRDAKVEVFDYQYTTGAGKHRHTNHFTVLHARVAGSPLPRFSLRPENVFDKIGDKVGYRDIDFESFPEFSKKYFLRGEDENAVRSLFGARLVQFFETNPGFCMESDGGSFILHSAKRRLKPEQIRPFAETGSRLLSLLR